MRRPAPHGTALSIWPNRTAPNSVNCHRNTHKRRLFVLQQSNITFNASFQLKHNNIAASLGTHDGEKPCLPPAAGLTKFDRVRYYSPMEYFACATRRERACTQ